MKKLIFFLLCLQLPFALVSLAQNGSFENEVRELNEKYLQLDWPKGGVVFTGSSSIRLWKSLEKDFPRTPIVNTGFGGSQTHHLLEFIDELVMQYSPSKVFIYEGDNDINSGKSSQQIIEEHFEIISKVKESLPDAKFYIISVKPSPSRWELKGAYLQLKEEMKQFCASQDHVTFIDVWTPMLDKTGNPNPKLFVEDMLHMNDKGYNIWKKAIEPYLK